MKRIKEKLAIGRDEFPNPLKCDAPINLRCLKEDVNRDDQVNVADSQAMLNFLLTTDPDSPDRLVTGYIYDVDGNGETDLVDFAAIVSCLGSAACPKSLNDI